MAGKKGVGLGAEECVGSLGSIWLVGGVWLETWGVWLRRRWARFSCGTKRWLESLGQKKWRPPPVTQDHSGRLSCLSLTCGSHSNREAGVLYPFCRCLIPQCSFPTRAKELPYRRGSG